LSLGCGRRRGRCGVPAVTSMLAPTAQKLGDLPPRKRSKVPSSSLIRPLAASSWAVIRSLTWSCSPPSPPPPLCSMTFVDRQLRKCMLGRVDSGACAPYNSRRASSLRRIEPSAQWRACSSRYRPERISMDRPMHSTEGDADRDNATTPS
jgi:hypothetical protein